MSARPPDDRSRLAGRLFAEHGAALYRYALVLLGDSAAAEDAVQHVFVALMKRDARAALDNEAHYLRRAVRNTCYSAHRHSGVRAAAIENGALLTPVDGAIVNTEERLTLERGIRALPVDQREVVHLHAFEGLTFREIAEASGDSINTVASRYRYALAKLREHLNAGAPAARTLRGGVDSAGAPAARTLRGGVDSAGAPAARTLRDEVE
jgi:RNA polymerase sigma-70 factor, ECF subfamily